MNDDKSIQKPKPHTARAAAGALKEPLSQEQIELMADLDKYTKEINTVQQKVDTLEAQKQELFRLGVRLEGIITYIKTRLGEISKT